MIKNLIAMAAVVVLTGCITMMMEESIGKPIDDVIIEFGTNYTATDLSDGRRMYEWTRKFSHQRSGTSTQTTTTKPERGRDGNTQMTTKTKTETTAPEITVSTCRYVFITNFDDQRKAWIVTSIRSPGFGC